MYRSLGTILRLDIIEISRHGFKHIGDSIMPLTTPGIDTKVKE